MQKNSLEWGLENFSYKYPSLYIVTSQVTIFCFMFLRYNFWHLDVE